MIACMNILRKFMTVFLAVALLLGGAFWWQTKKQEPATQTQTTLRRAEARIKTKVFTLYVATSPKDMQVGLAAYDSLAEHQGMIFRGLTAGQQGMWMKHMKFDIDIIWVDSHGTIVHIEPLVSKDSYPKVYQNPPNTTSQYVIELAAGVCQKYGIARGEHVELGN